MQRLQKTTYCDDRGREMLSIKNGKASLEGAYRDYGAEEIRELGMACLAAAEELEAMESLTTAAT